MKKFISLMIVFSFVSTTTLAHPGEQLPLFPEIEYKELLQQINEACENMGNGGCYDSKYDVTQFDYATTLKKLTAEYYDAERDYQYIAITDVRDILGDRYLKEAQLTDVLKKLIKMNAVKAMMQFVPDDTICTESESCSISNIYLFLADGQLIHMEFDFTD